MVQINRACLLILACVVTEYASAFTQLNTKPLSKNNYNVRNHQHQTSLFSATIGTDAQSKKEKEILRAPDISLQQPDNDESSQNGWDFVDKVYLITYPNAIQTQKD